MRDFVFILGDRYERAGQLVEGTVVNSYFYRGYERAGSRALQVAADALVIFADLFGEYPYAELDVVATPNWLGGMEYPGLVVVEDRLYSGGGLLDWLVAHEVAHQWWFGVVGSDQVDVPWLDEALTQYSTVLYYERTYGENRARAILNSFAQTHQNLVRSRRDRPAGLSAASYDPNLYWDIVYRKGALYFDSLREAVGDEVFFDILQTYYDRHRYRIATPESFLETVEDVAGDRYLDIYEEWILDAPD
jgi:aminopeptidase N